MSLLFIVLMVLVAAGLILAARVEADQRWRRDDVGFRLEFPRGLRPEQVVAWLGSLPPARRGDLIGRPPIVFEVAASSAGIEHVLHVHRAEADGVLSQLTAALPGVRISKLPGGDVYENASFTGTELRTTSATFPLSTDRVEASSAAVLASLLPLDDGEVLRLQWVVRAAAVPAVAHLRRDGAAWLDDGGVERPEDVQGLRRKTAEPSLQAVARVAVAAATPLRRAQLLARVEAGMSVIAGPGVQLRRRSGASPTTARRLQRRAVPLVSWPTPINALELAGLFGVPLGDVDLPGLRLSTARQLPAEPQRLTDGVLLGLSDHPGTWERPLRLADDDRLQHLHLVGPTGTGKSTVVASLALQDMVAGHGVIVLDPKRDLVDAVLARVPAHRRDDVVVLDPVDVARPVGLNVLARSGDSEAERELVTEHLLGVFESLWTDSWGPRSDDVLRSATITLCSARAPDGSAFTFVELPELLMNTVFRKYVLAQETVPDYVRGFWRWFEDVPAWERTQALAAPLNKLRAFGMRTPVRLMLGQSEGLHLPTLLAERKVVLVPLSAGELGRPAAELLGSLTVAALWQAIQGRTRLAPEDRPKVFVALDEFQSFVRLPIDLADLLAQARGLGASLTLAHQHLGQLDRQVRDAVLGTARSQVVFQVGPDDARTLARGFEPSLTAADLMGLPAYHFALRPVWQGQVIRPVTGRTLPLPETDDSADVLRRASREAYGVPRGKVEDALRARLGAAAAQPDVPIGRRRRKSS